MDLPEWLFGLVSDHIARTRPKPCICHGFKYVFGGYRAANGAAGRPGPKLADVARRAGVSIGTASAAINRPETVLETTRAKVQTAADDLGYIPGSGSSGELAAHWRRNSFATRLFHPAATGWYPKKTPQEPSPVPVLANPWPGVSVRGRNAAGRADSCWLPIAPRLTPHGLRHEDGSVQARYSHVTPDMRQRLMAGLTSLWEAALATRREMAPGSPVAALDRLLKGNA